jgi:hypothetical protein
MHPHGCWSHSHRHESTAGMSRFKSILFHNFASKIWANLQLQSAATGQLGGLMLPKCILYASTWPPLSGFGLTLFLSQQKFASIFCSHNASISPAVPQRRYPYTINCC